jgi:Xaa-Pro dipeptidase
MIPPVDEAATKRARAREAAGDSVLVASTQATTRWLLCGRGRPVDVGSVDFTVVLREADAFVLFADLEGPRVEAEERFAQLGYEHLPYPWHEGPGPAIARLTAGKAIVRDDELEERIAPHRRELAPEELVRYRIAGAAAAAAFRETFALVRPELSELDAAGQLSYAALARGLQPRVVLVAGERRQPVYRHPVPTRALLGRHALLALTAEQEGLHVSMTRLVSFGPAPQELAELQRAAAEIDAAVIGASEPGRTHGELLEVLIDAYATRGFPDEWKLHHQGGLTGYKGREVFATPGEPTPLPGACAVAWNPSLSGGAKSEDTVLVTEAGIDVITRTEEQPELSTDAGIPRPGIVELPRARS